MTNMIPSHFHDQMLFKQAYWQSLRSNIDLLVKYGATVGVLGKRKTGKSTLCHALVGDDSDQLDVIDNNATFPVELTLAHRKGRGISVIDMPGLGSVQQPIPHCYESLLPELDLVLWVIRADDPDWHVDLAFYQQILAAHCQQRYLPVLLICNDFNLCETGKITHQQQIGLWSYFNSSAVCTVSAQTGGGIYHLFEHILTYLPQQRYR